MSEICPYCRADEESILIVPVKSRPFDENQRECRSCGCEWDARDPSRITFAYDDPREAANG